MSAHKAKTTRYVGAAFIVVLWLAFGWLSWVGFRQWVDASSAQASLRIQKPLLAKN